MTTNNRDVPFGRLNPIRDNFAPNKDRLNLSEPSFFKGLRDSLKDRYTPDVLAGNTEYKAIVLKVLPEDADGGIPHWLAPFNELFGAKTALIRVIARIPELHAHLPLPRNDEDNEIFGMYPIFEGAVNNGKPEPGQIIRVTFQNIYNFSGPVYLGTLSAEGGAAGVLTTENLNSKEISKTGKEYDPKVPNNPEPIKTYSRAKDGISQIVIHESITATAQGALNVLASNKLSVHLTVDTNGTVKQHVDLKDIAYHAGQDEKFPPNGHNQSSIAIEVINRYSGSTVKPEKTSFTPLVDDFSKPKKKVIEGIWVYRGKDGGNKGRKDPTKGLYIVPPIGQLEAVWNLIKKLCQGPPEGVDASKFTLKLQFPAVKQTGNMIQFYWGRWSGHIGAIGIMAHHRWDHADGLFIEHYCVCRHYGYSMQDSYRLTLENAQKASTKDRSTYIYGV